MTKMNEYGLNMVFKMIKLTSKAVFYHLYQNILPLFIINWPLLFKMGKKSLFLSKISSIIFLGNVRKLCATMSPMCNTFLGSLGVAHWVVPSWNRNFGYFCEQKQNESKKYFEYREREHNKNPKICVFFHSWPYRVSLKLELENLQQFCKCF